jgi:hypothetical protein
MVILVLFYGYSAVGASLPPLFASDDVLKITLKAPFSDMKKSRNKETQYEDARVSYLDDLGNAVEIPVTLSVRGNSRLDFVTCSFPPLRLQFDKKFGKNTIFSELKKVKMVTQCQPKSTRSEDDLLTEYQAYRVLNSLTKWSYRVRLLDVTFGDSDGGKTHQNFAFVIEPSKILGKRSGAKKINVDTMAANALIGGHMNLVSLYQLMVGNTDWSATQGSGEECCHNGKLFGDKTLSQVRFVPYDFDMTGLVKPKYAVTSEKVNLSSVRQRRYRGYCQNLEHLNENVTLLNEKRDEIISILNSDIGLSKNKRKKNLHYVEKFYKLINNNKRLSKHVSRFCLNAPATEPLAFTLGK